MVDIASLAVKLTELVSSTGGTVPSGSPDPALVREFQEALAGSGNESSASGVEGFGEKSTDSIGEEHFYSASGGEEVGRTSPADATDPSAIKFDERVEGVGTVQEHTAVEGNQAVEKTQDVWDVQSRLLRAQTEHASFVQSTSSPLHDVKSALAQAMSDMTTKGALAPQDLLRIQNLTGMLQQEILQMSRVNKSVQDTVASVTKAQ